MKKLSVKIILALILFPLSCAATDKHPGTRIKIDPYWNELARYLAGMPLESNGKFAKLVLQDYYHLHTASMDAFWSRVKRENIDLISNWRSALIPASRETGTVLYPFSGADLINLFTIYPNATSYVMIALEEPGRVPDPLLLNPTQLSLGLSSIRRAISTIASENYFQSGIMNREMANRYLTGTLPVLMIFAARLNMVIADVETVGLNKKGEVTAVDQNGFVDGKRPAIYGCRLVLFTQGGKTPKTLVYLKIRLHDSCLNGNTPEALFFKKMPTCNTMIKSAVYLLHTEGFKKICMYMQDKSTLIIQDDSGIPFRYFNSEQWSLALYGTYRYPQKLKDLPYPPHQPSLTRAYELKCYPLPFNFGYGVKRGKGKSNLLLAVKK